MQLKNKPYVISSSCVCCVQSQVLRGQIMIYIRKWFFWPKPNHTISTVLPQHETWIQLTQTNQVVVNVFLFFLSNLHFTAIFSPHPSLLSLFLVSRNITASSFPLNRISKPTADNFAHWHLQFALNLLLQFHRLTQPALWVPFCCLSLSGPPLL